MKRFVLYAEGAGELMGSLTRLPPVGTQLPEEALGAAHILFRRVIANIAEIDQDAVRFDVPMLTRARQVRGSDLLDRARLRELLTWPRAEQRPDAAIVLVDADGTRQRGTELRENIRDRVPNVVAVAIEEFESWLIAHHEQVRLVLGAGHALAGAVNEPEKLKPTEAKTLLNAWFAEAKRSQEQALIRRQIADSCSLETLKNRCRSFADVASDLRALITA